MTDELVSDNLGNKAGMGAEALERAADAPLRELGFTHRLHAALADAGLESVADVARASGEELARLFGVGPGSVTHVVDALRNWVTCSQRTHGETGDRARIRSPQPDAAPSLADHDSNKDLGKPLITEPLPDSVAAQPIRVLGLSACPHNCLGRAGIQRVGDLAGMTPQQVLSIRSLGSGSLREIIRRLREHLGVAARLQEARSVHARRTTRVLRAAQWTEARDDRPSLLRVALMCGESTAKAAASQDGPLVSSLGLSRDTIAALARLDIGTDDFAETIGRSTLGYLVQELSAQEIDELTEAWFSRGGDSQTDAFAARVESEAGAATLLGGAEAEDSGSSVHRLRVRVLERPTTLLGLSEGTESALREIGVGAIGDLEAVFERDVLREVKSIGRAAVAVSGIRAAISRLLERISSPDAFCYVASSLRELLRMHVTARLSESASERNQAICLQRWGLAQGQRERERASTLGELGEAFGLTRERIRQIVSRGEKLVRGRRGAALTEVKLAVEETLGNSLGLCSVSYLGQRLRERYVWDAPPGQPELMLLLRLIPGVDIGGLGEVVHTSRCRPLWRAARTHADQLLDDVEEPEHFLDFVHRLAHQLSKRCWRKRERRRDIVPCCGARNGRIQLPPEYVRLLLSGMDPCPLQGERVVNRPWAVLRRGRRKMAVVRAALRVLGEPTHFRNVARFIREHSERFSHLSDHSVHNGLIADDECVLTEELGMYGLRRWGVKRYRTAADCVEAHLVSRGEPTHVTEIVRALREKGIPEGNVRACFNQRRFVTYSDGYLGLRAWEESTGSAGSSDEGITSDVFLFDDRQDELIIG